MTPGWLTDTVLSQNLLDSLRLQLFFDVMEEARLGPGKTDTTKLSQHLEGRELLGRTIIRLRELLDKEWESGLQ